MNWTLEVVWVPVSDVDHAKAFYAEQLGFNVDHDTQVSEGNRIVQLTPPGSGCSIVIGEGTIAPNLSYVKEIEKVDLVVFSTPQLSLVEMQQVAVMLDGRRATIPILVVTSPQVKPDADRMGLTARIEAAGGTVLSGMCFYQSYAREMAEANGWKRLATNSAKLTNIIGGYGYKPALLSMEACVETACAGGRIAS